MNKKDKLIFFIVGMIVVLMIGMTIWSYSPTVDESIQVKVELQTDNQLDCQLYYTTDENINDQSFKENCVDNNKVTAQNEKVILSFEIPYETKQVRFDMGEGVSNITIYKVVLQYKEHEIDYKMEDVLNVSSYRDVSSYFQNESGYVEVITDSKDPFVVWNLKDYAISELVEKDYSNFILIIRLIISVVCIFFVCVLWWKRAKWTEIPSDIYANKRMIWNLAKTDFKRRYSASYFGAIWAFVQPVVTIAIYAFVFQVGFKAGGTTSGYPFLLYLVAGIIPWFFFAEAWMNATNCLVEYNYLVKKVVFKITVLPVVKILSSLFVHLFFIVLALLVFVLNGMLPGVQFVQIVYYLVCVFALALALSYFTAAVIPFFQDLAQIINIITQLGMWTIPIMYEESLIGEKIMRFLRLNPMYYVVTGYRDAYMNGEWFWEKSAETAYFWLVVIALFGIGFGTFKKLKVHFADVL